LSIYKPHQSGADAFNIAEWALGAENEKTLCYAENVLGNTLVITYTTYPQDLSPPYGQLEQVPITNVDSSCVVGLEDGTCLYCIDGATVGLDGTCGGSGTPELTNAFLDDPAGDYTWGTPYTLDDGYGDITCLFSPWKGYIDAEYIEFVKGNETCANRYHDI